MLYYIKTATEEYTYDDGELSAADAAKRAAFFTRLAAFRAWLDANPRVKVSTLSGVALIAYNAVVTLLKTAGAQLVVTHVIQRGLAQIVVAAPTYAATWDGHAPFVSTLAGVFPPGGIPFSGWPQTDAPLDPAPIRDPSTIVPDLPAG